jgi:hypothetical protein
MPGDVDGGGRLQGAAQKGDADVMVADDNPLTTTLPDRPRIGKRAPADKRSLITVTTP